MTGSGIVITRRIDASPEAVWKALTDPGKISQWWGEGVKIEPRVGGRFEEPWTDENGRPILTSGEVLSIEPGRELRLSWKDEDWPAFTQVSFRLENEGKQTIFTVIHEGWDGLVGLDVEKLVAEHRAGWIEIVASFHKVVLSES